MKRGRPPKYRLRHEMSLALDVAELRRRGYLTPGIHAGIFESVDLTGRFFVAPTVEVAVACRADSGELSIAYAPGGPIPLVRVSSGAGRRPRRDWFLVCRCCSRRVRRLYRPYRGEPGAPPAPWACRHCWALSYSPGGRREMIAEAGRLVAATGLAAEVASRQHAAAVRGLAMVKALARAKAGSGPVS